MFAAAAERYPEQRDGRHREVAAVLALAEAAGDSTPRLVNLLLAAGSAVALVEARAAVPAADRALARALAARIRPGSLEDWAAVVAGTLARSPGLRLLAVTEPAYPVNLLGLPRPPAYVFVRGEIRDDDRRAIAVVGSRAAGAAHLDRAAEIAAMLAGRGVTVVSGLAAGVDTAAHAAALRAGGRTIAAVATGVDRVYPPVNAELAKAIEAAGAVVSRQWPDAPPSRMRFRLRNAITSGLSLATVVVEAGPTGGARLQARLAVEQHRRVVLLGHLPRRDDWARRMASRRGVVVAEDAGEVLDVVADLVDAPRSGQLTLF